MNRSGLLVNAPTASLSCQVAAHAALTMTADQLPVLRRQPGPPAAQPLSPSFLKHSDRQTVAGLAAVLHAIHDHGLAAPSLRHWGVITGPVFLGRQGIIDAIQRFLAEGAFGISPHIIPHQSLHAISGTVSQALELHGPNFGVGGGPAAADEALLVAATLLAAGTLPGLWVVLTEVEAETIQAGPGDAAMRTTPTPWTCHAVALALVPASGPNAGELKLTITNGASKHSAPRHPAPRHTAVRRAEAPPLRIADLAANLSAAPEAPQCWRLRHGGHLFLGDATTESAGE